MACWVQLSARHKDFSDLYEKMSGSGESAVLSPSEVPSGRVTMQSR